MNYSGVKWLDTANGPGSRVSLFVSGCPHHCPACFNKETWDFSFGSSFTPQVESEIFAALQQQGIDGLSILGGEPFAPQNQVSLYLFICKLRHDMPDADVWIYSGYTAEELLFNGVAPISKALSQQCDVLVDGPFIQELRDITLEYRGSSNQRLVDIKESVEKGEIVLWNPKS